MRARVPALALLVLAGVLDARAAGFDCKAASTPTERAICADTTLRQRDAALAEAYAKALAASPDLRAELRQQQREWLTVRNSCAADARCLAKQYDQRIAAFGMPDKADMEALDELRQALETLRKTDPELPLDKIIHKLGIAPGGTGFANEDDPGDTSEPAHFPRKRPRGVSEAEWRAMLASKVDGGGENGRANYTLVDIDGDGLRDLVIDSYTGGTGLFSTISVVRQAGGRFTLPGAGPASATPASPDEPDASYLYSLNGRGSNQAAEWIRLRGRVYAMYRDSRYGEDNLYLLRPWHGSGQVPRLRIRYRYRLSVPALQQEEGRAATRLPPALHGALNQAVASAATLGNKEAVARTTPICPLPAGAPDDMREANLSYGTGHYTIEDIADVPVMVGTQCHIGRLRDWFGGYTPKSGLDAQICIRKPEDLSPSEEACYTVEGPRTVVGITAGVGPFPH